MHELGRRFRRYGYRTDYNYFRDYDPQTGRYIESDPIGLGSHQNTYDYVDDNPVWTYDPQGLEPKPLPWQRNRPRPCTSQEQDKCKADCGKRGVAKCEVNQTFRITIIRPPVIRYEWKDGPMQCTCNEDPESCPILKRAAAAVGLSIPAYLIISEGSRILFPPRNLVPVP